ncbi:MAG: DUF4837 family protein [Candidatus Krumholzibacteria bacterium]|nr:DUF4837 family protein [Candidatus Krumholzibacteria bacterium]
MSRSFVRLALEFLTAAFVLSCTSQGGPFNVPAAGSYSGIVLVTETGAIDGPTTAMVNALQHELDFYTKNELQFRVRVVPAAQFDKEIPIKNMVIFGIVNQGGVGSIIEQFIGSSGVRGVLEGKYSVFKKMDSPVNGQLTVIVTAVSNDILARIASEQGAVIRNIIEDGNRERIRESMLKEGENVPLERDLKDRYGFTFSIPKVYALEEQMPELPGISLIHPEPPRVISVSWRSLDHEGVSLADSNELYKLRADVSFKLFDKYVMNRDLVRFSNAQLGSYPAVRMDGYWESSIEPAGGSFVSFFVADRVKSRVWLVDCLVYAPGQNKNELLREAIAIAETFSL